jgi:hypothetical protein
MEWKLYGREWSWHNLKYQPSISVGAEENHEKGLSQNLNAWPLKHKAGHNDSLCNYKIKQISKDNLIFFQKIRHPWQVSEHIPEISSPCFMRHHPLQHYAY